MKAVEFCYWLQGHFELNGAAALDEKQAKMVQSHLNLVFHHDIDPSQGLTPEQEDQAQAIHDGDSNDIDPNIIMRC